MNIHTDSWHYKFIENSPFQPNRNFCKYFWQTPAILTIYIGMITIGLLVTIFVLSPWLSLIVSWYSGHPIMWIMGAEGSYISLALQALVSIAALFIYALNKLINWVSRLPPSVPKPPGLISIYYTTWKDKYCPTLTFIYKK